MEIYNDDLCYSIIKISIGHRTMKMRKKKNLSDIVPIYSPRTTYKKIKSTDEKMIADMTLNFVKLTINLLK